VEYNILRHKVKSSGVVKVFSINHKTDCTHKNKVEYCIRDGFKYWFCLDCKNLIREPLS
jgi:hypothetical protein